MLLAEPLGQLWPLNLAHLPLPTLSDIVFPVKGPGTTPGASGLPGAIAVGTFRGALSLVLQVPYLTGIG